MRSSSPVWTPLLLSCLLGCASTVAPPLEEPEPNTRVETAPATGPAQAEALDRTRTAAQELGARLKTNLVATMSAEGPGAAARFCSLEAQGLTSSPGDARGVRVGRASLRLRNPSNAGPAWVTEWLEKQGERSAAGVHGFERIDTLPNGSEVARVLRPLTAGGPCVLCHGSIESLAPGVTAVLQAHYPEDEATGYSVGDLRGALWAEGAVGGLSAPELSMFGALRAVMHNADYGSKVALQELLSSGGGHGPGALKGLAGEITFDEGTAWVSTPDGAGGIHTTRITTGGTTDLGVALLAFHRVEGWTTRPLADAASLEELGDRIRDAAHAAGLGLEQPIPFRIEGRLEGLSYHVIDGVQLPPGPSSHEAHQAAAIRVEHGEIEGTLVGVWSTEHAGVFTHMGETTHVHVTIEEPLGSGHVDAVRLSAGVELSLPRPESATPR